MAWMGIPQNGRDFWPQSSIRAQGSRENLPDGLPFHGDGLPEETKKREKLGSVHLLELGDLLLRLPYKRRRFNILHSIR
jgi:hypothetical protein